MPMRSQMPLRIVVWLANPVFVGLPVLITFISLFWVLPPPHTFEEALLESLKIILIGGFALAGVAVVEVALLLALHAESDVVRAKLNFIVFCLLGLLAIVVFAAELYSAALAHNVQSAYSGHSGVQADLILQTIAGLLVFAFAIFLAVKLKFIEHSAIPLYKE